MRGRKQHRYHPRYRAVRDEAKYDRMIAFAKSLPKIHRATKRDLKKKAMTKEHVLAAVVRVMERTLIRVGNEEYAKTNNSYGLTTLEDKHAKVRGRTVTFEFRGKSGKEHEIDLDDPRLAEIVKKCQDLPGEQLFQYLDDDGNVVDVTSSDVNEYLRSIAGEEFTAKDFRTWAGTVLAARRWPRWKRSTQMRRERKTSSAPSKPWPGAWATRRRSVASATFIPR